MKTSEEFKAEVYEKRDRKLAARRRVKKQALLCVPLAFLVVLGSVFAPRLFHGKHIQPRTGNIPRLLQVGTPAAPKDLSFYNLMESAEYAQLQKAGDSKEGDSKAMTASDGDRYWGLEESELKELSETALIDPAFSTVLNDFARSSTVLLSKEFTENSCYSPLSLYYALALTGSGAGGTTKREFESVLGAQVGWVEDQCGKYYRQHYHDNEESKFWLANSLWMDGRYSFGEDFISGAEKNFYSALFQVDFTDPSLGEEMTKWVSENTGGLLNPKFTFSEEQMLSIINTVYYNAQWSDQFSQEYNTNEEFHKADGSTVTAEFMHMGKGFGRAYEGTGFTRASLSLRNGDEMIFILPDEGVSTEELLSDPAAFENMFYPKASEEFTSCQLRWSVPKFSFDCEYDLKNMLIDLGLEKAFDPVIADFSNMGKVELYLSEARQGAHIGVNEDGVEAAAYTELGFEAGAAAPPDKIIEMKLDRPFLFAILSSDASEGMTWENQQETRNSSLLFLGACGDPTASGNGDHAAAS